MNINIVCVGKLKEKYFADACNEYCKRLSRFCKLEIIEIEECPFPEKSLQIEGEKILQKLSGFVVLLDVGAVQMASEDFSAFISQTKEKSATVCFVIGSSLGLSEEVKARADKAVSFSKMTFPHMLFRVMLCEQIYRAFMIESNSKYHK